jgi:hypothetical protein
MLPRAHLVKPVELYIVRDDKQIFIYQTANVDMNDLSYYMESMLDLGQQPEFNHDLDQYQFKVDYSPSQSTYFFDVCTVKLSFIPKASL